jgi:hypothetical protein
LDAAAYTLGGVALGFIGQAVLARQREQTELRLAQDARLSERRSALYERVMAADRRQLTIVGHIYPILEYSGAPAGPDDITYDEAIAITSQLDTWSTKDVADAHEAFADALRKFEGVVRTQEATELQRTGLTGRLVKPSNPRQAIEVQRTGRQGIGTGEPYMLIDAARTEVKDRYADLMVAVRRETNPQVRATGVRTRLRAVLPSRTAKPPS